MQFLVKVDGINKEYNLMERGWRQRPKLKAVDGVSFSIAPGEIVGMVGANGSGKSTVLKLLARITQPTQGVIERKSSFAALLAVNELFHPELTGREHLYLLGGMLGISKRGVDEQLAMIMRLARIEGALDRLVKRYSSGMRARLALSLLLHSQQRLLLLDEMFLVSDMGFRQQIFTRMRDLQRQGASVLFVSHDLTSVAQLADRVFVLHRGRLVFDGQPQLALDYYKRTLS